MLVLATLVANPAQAITLSLVAPTSLASIVQTMNTSASDAATQVTGCSALARAVPTSSKAAQDRAASAGVIDVSIAAMQHFPDVKEVQVACSHAVANLILFNRQNGLRAGRLSLLWEVT